MSFNKTKRDATMMEQELAPNNFLKINIFNLQTMDMIHQPRQMYQLRVPDAACNSPILHTISLVLKDCYDRWNPKSWTK